MNELILYRGALVFAAVLELAFATWVLRLRPAALRRMAERARDDFHLMPFRQHFCQAQEAVVVRLREAFAEFGDDDDVHAYPLYFGK